MPRNTNTTAMTIIHRITSLLVTILIALLLSSAVFARETMIIKDKGIEIEAFVFGQGQQTLIIGAGNGRPAADLEELAKGIAAGGIRVVTYNYRTIGASKGPIVGLTLHDYAQDVWRIADALGAKKVHLAGKTYGNRVMRTAASDQPERTMSITLIGAGGEILPSAEIQESQVSGLCFARFKPFSGTATRSCRQHDQH